MPVAALAMVAAVGAAAFADAAWSWRGAEAEAWVVEPGGARAAVVRLIQGRPTKVRVELDWRGSGQARLAWLAMTEKFADAVNLPKETISVHFAGKGGGAYSSGRFRLPELSVHGMTRGLHSGLCCGLEQRSRMRLWRLRQWREMPCAFAVYPDPAPGRTLLLRSPIFRALSAVTILPQAGQGREFERLREYQPGDIYADVNWKATARRAYPVTRLYQRERQQEVLFVVDHSRLSRGALDLFIETALVGASAANDVGDRFGLLTASDEVTGWLPASSGRAHFQAVRERLLRLPLSPIGADRPRLCAALAQRLRRRCYILLLANLTERGQGEELLGSAGKLARTHVVLAQSVLPSAVRPLLHTAHPAKELPDIYAALAGDSEWQRLEALRMRLRQAGIEFRAMPAGQFLGAALGLYLNAKREQRL